MSRPENVRGWELATEEELRRLYCKTKRLLTEHGTYYIEPVAVVEGVHDGLPITDIQPEFSIRLTPEEVQVLSSEAIETLCLGGPLEIIYWEPCYVHLTSGELEYTNPNCAFNMPQRPGMHYSNRYLAIYLNKNNSVESIGCSELRERLITRPDLTKPEILSDLMEQWRLESQTGVNQMTTGERAVLEEIVDGFIKINV